MGSILVHKHPLTTLFDGICTRVSRESPLAVNRSHVLSFSCVHFCGGGVELAVLSLSLRTWLDRVVTCSIFQPWAG